MERMQHSFWTIVPRLTGAANTTTIYVGPIAERLVKIVQAIHATWKSLVVDVKPDNFMFAYGDDKDGTPQNWATRLRLLDLGLIQSYSGEGGHRPNEENCGLVGTPLYASLHVHDGNKVSRRDDLEAVGYVIAELVIRLVATLNGNTNDFERTSFPSYLPWSSGTSDQAVGAMKKENVASKASVFYARMGQGNAADIIYDYLTSVNKISYKENPNYDELCEKLRPLTVEVGNTMVATKRSAATKRVASSKKVAAVKRVTATNKVAPPNKADAVNKAEATEKRLAIKSAPSPKKALPSVAKLPRSPLTPCSVAPAQPNADGMNADSKPVATRKSNRRKIEMEEDFEYDEDAPRHKKTLFKMDKSKPKEIPLVAEHPDVVEEMDYFPSQEKILVKTDRSKPADVDAFETQGVEDMDIDMLDAADDNVNVKSSLSTAQAGPNKSKVGMLRVTVMDGTRTGDSFLLKTNETEVVIIGSDPPRTASRAKATTKTESFPGDKEMAPRHVQLTLGVRHGISRVEIKDLKSKQPTYVGLSKLESGNSTLVIPPVKIRVGATTLSVSRPAM